MIDVGEKIRYIRETYDVKGNELADILNISKSSISHYEKMTAMFLYEIWSKYPITLIYL